MSRRLLVLLGLAIVTLASGLVLVLRGLPERHRGPGDSARSSSAPGDASAGGGPGASAAVRFEDFVGAQVCADCHPAAYRAWAASTHGEAGGPPDSGTVIAPFDGTPIRFRDARVVPRVEEDGTYVFLVEWEGRGTHRLEVEGVVGKGHMVGGGTQAYFGRAEDGTYRMLPFDFSRTEGRWFCNTIGRRDRGWRFTEGLDLADCVDWTPRRALGTIPRLESCQECHGSQIRVRVRRGAPHFATDFKSLRIDCEACHGPGRTHVELAREGEVPGKADIGLRDLALLDTDASLGVCFRCHALKTTLRPGYLAGKPFERHYALKLPTLGENPYLADGRARTFVYQGTHLSSECYLRGSMSCVDCHDPHTQTYRDHTGAPLSGRFDDGQCTSCHASRASPEAKRRHTHHPPDSEGSRCVACHMPYVQQPELGPDVRYARSDHTIPVPRPAVDDSTGLASACAGCHQERSPRQLAAAARAWWGELKPLEPLVRGQLEVEGVEDLGSAAGLLLRPEEHNPVAQAAGLGRLLTERLRPDMEEVEPEVRRRLEPLARSRDPELAGLALAALHYAYGGRPDVQRLLTERAHRLGEEPALREAVEDRWALALGYLADEHRDRGEPSEAVTTYRKALEIRPDDPAVHFALGRALGWAGDAEGAIRAYRRTLELEPTRALAHVNLGIVYAALGREDSAVAAYRRAADVNPAEPLAHFNLANLHLRARRAEPAIEGYRRTIELDGALAPAHVNLGRALLLARRPQEALRALRTGLAFEPADSAAARLARELEAALGGR